MASKASVSSVVKQSASKYKNQKFGRSAKKTTEVPRQLKRSISASVPPKVEVKRARLISEVKPEVKSMKSIKPDVVDKENKNRGTWSRTSTLAKKSVPPKPSIASSAPLKNAALKNSASVSATKSSGIVNRVQTATIKHVSSVSVKASVSAGGKGVGRRSTLTHSFLANKNLKQKQLVGKVISDGIDAKKTVLGTLHGKVVQSKINSFRKPVPPGMEKASVVDCSKSESALQKQKCSSTADKNNCRAGADLKKRCSVISTTEKKTASHQTDLKLTATAANVPKKCVPVRPSFGGFLKSEPSGVTIRRSIKSASDLQKKRESQLGKPAGKTDGDHLDGMLQISKGGKKPTARPSILPSSRRESMLNVTKQDAKRPTTCPSQIKTFEESKVSASSKHTISKESNEQQRTQMNSWMNSKGKAVNRRASLVPLSEVPKLVAVEEPVKSFWTTIVEEDEQGAFIDSVNQTLTECTKLINEGCLKEKVLAILQNLVNNIPSTKKFGKYWECLARLEEMEGPISNVIAIYEEAIEAQAQPIDDLRNSLAEILKKAPTPLKPSHNAVVTKREKDQEVKLADTVAENEESVVEGETADNFDEDGVMIKDVENAELEPQTASRKHRRHRRKCKLESVEETLDENESPSNQTPVQKSPSKTEDGSSVVKYNVRTTPYLQGVKKNIPCEESSSAVKELKFLTPVRRSRRIECRAGRLPTMLKDHDPAVSTIQELVVLEGEINAYVCRQNNALQEVTNLSDCTND